MPRRPNPQKDWCFTLNNPRTKDRERIQKWQYDYLVFQLEVGEEGTPHLQGFVQFAKQHRLSVLKKLDQRIHWEPRRGSAIQAAHYCKKPEPDCTCKHCDGVPRIYPQYIFENGDISAPASERLATVAKSLKYKGLTKTIESYPTHYIRMKAGIEGLATFYSPVRQWRPVVTVLWGGPDLGKTRYALKGPTPYVLAVFGKGTDFFGDYRPDYHETLVIDDFYSNWKYTTFLRVPPSSHS